jgi:hypothetical protein
VLSYKPKSGVEYLLNCQPFMGLSSQNIKSTVEYHYIY